MHVRSLATVVATAGLFLGAWSGAACVGSDPGVPESYRSSLHGNVAEVIVVKGNLTNAQLADLDTYFKTKHGL